jgi:putative transposase
MLNDYCPIKMATRRGVTKPRRAKSKRTKRLGLALPNTWGGKRAGAGRKPGPRPNTPHRARLPHVSSQPVHVTLRSKLTPLRSQQLFPTIQLAIRDACHREPKRFRVLHFSVQREHVHLIVEASDEQALSSGMRSVAIRIARYVNDLLSRRGPLWADRWRGRALTSPRQVRNALLDVLANFRKDARRGLAPGIDAYSSAAWFDGWQEWTPSSGSPPPLAEGRRPPWLRDFDGGRGPGDTGDARGDGTDGVATCPVVGARTWLAAHGWRQHGLLHIGESPQG